MLVNSRPWLAIILAGFGALVCTSCGSDSGRFPVEGEVTFDGEAVDKGSIVFMPVDTGAIKTGGPISEGRYKIPAEKGPVVGSHRVLLYWEKKTGTTYKDSETGDVYDRRKEGLPEVYHSEDTPLKVDIVAGENVHNFHLKSTADQ